MFQKTNLVPIVVGQDFENDRVGGKRNGLILSVENGAEGGSERGKVKVFVENLGQRNIVG